MPQILVERNKIEPWPFIIFGLSLIFNLIYFIQLRSTPYYSNLYLDPAYYWRMAERIAAGNWLGSEVYEMSPLYSYLLAVLLKLGFSLGGIRLLQIFLASLTPVMTFYLGRRIMNRPSAIIAGMTMTCYQTLLVYNNMIMKSWLSPLFFISCALLLTAQDNRLFSRFAAGVVWGLLCLVRANNLLILPLLMVWLYRQEQNKNKAVAAFILGLILVIAQVTIRNYVVSKEFVMITAGGGEVFYIGSLPENKGEYHPPPFVQPDPVREHDDFRAEARRRTQNRGLTRQQSSRFWFQEGLNLIAEKPTVYLKNLVRKFALFWNAFEIPDNHNVYFLKGILPILRLPLISFGVLAPLGLLGLGLHAYQKRSITLPLVLLAGSWLAIAPFFLYARFRLGIIPFLALGTGFSLNYLWTCLKNRSYKTPALWVSALFFLLLFVHIPFAFERQKHQAISHANLGSLYYRQGDYDSALNQFDKAIRLDLFNELAKRYQVLTYVKLGDYKKALADLEQLKPLLVSELDYYRLKFLVLKAQRDYEKLTKVCQSILTLIPNDFEANFTLGALLGQAGRFQEAITHLEIAKAVHPDNENVRLNLDLAYQALQKK